MKRPAAIPGARSCGTRLKRSGRQTRAMALFYNVAGLMSLVGIGK
jgi:hypothetical protein